MNSGSKGALTSVLHFYLSKLLKHFEGFKQVLSEF